jgi:hypothetical protein
VRSTAWCVRWRKEDYGVLVRDGFRVEVGGAHPTVILRAVQACLTREGIDSVSIVLKTGRKALLSRADTGV